MLTNFNFKFLLYNYFCYQFVIKKTKFPLIYLALQLLSNITSLLNCYKFSDYESIILLWYLKVGKMKCSLNYFFKDCLQMKKKTIIQRTSFICCKIDEFCENIIHIKDNHYVQCILLTVCCTYMKYIAYVCIVDHNGESDSKQDAGISPSWWDGTNIWQFFSCQLGFWLILLIGILTPAIAFANPAADPGSTQVGYTCMCLVLLKSSLNNLLHIIF